MITKDYVSFEVAKLLKEKGFYQDFLNEIIPVWKLNGNKEELSFYGDNNYPCEWEEWYSAPTLQMACKWLREVHNIFIAINVSWPEGDMRNPMSWRCEIIDTKTTKRDHSNFIYRSTYEEEVDAAIKYVLENLI